MVVDFTEAIDSKDRCDWDDRTNERYRPSGRPRTARKVHNIDSVDKLAVSQEDKPGTHSTQRVTCCIRLVVPWTRLYVHYSKIS